MSSPANPLAVCIPLQVDAFVLNEPVCAGKYARIAPLSLPDYGTLGPGTHLEHDVIPHLDLRAAAPASINSRLTDLASGTPRRDRLGIYLHWTVPKPFRASVTSSNPDSKQHNEKREQRGVPEGSDFLAVPDRWVIIRRLICSTSAPKDMSRLCGFVVESNRVRRLDRDELDQLDLDTEAAPFIDRDSGTHAQHGVLLGAKYPLQGWAEVPENQYHSPLTIADAANPLFADFQHHCMNVFAIHDDLSCFDEEKNAWHTLDNATVSYLVVGFHADSQQDPLAASKADSNRALLESHRMTLPKPAVASTTNVSENPWLDEAPSKRHRVRSLCHGIVSPLRWSQKELPGRVPADEAAQHFTRQQPIAIGTDLIDALTASVTAPADASVADRAQAEAFKHLETLATDPGDDGQETSSAAQKRSNQFKPVPGGHIWTWKKSTADTAKHGASEAGIPAPVAESTKVQASGSQGTAAPKALEAATPIEQPLATAPSTTPPTAVVGSPASSAKPTQVLNSPDANTELQLRQLNATQALHDSALRYSSLLQHQLFCEWWKARAAGFGDPGEDDSEPLPDDGFESMQRWYTANLPATRGRLREILTKLYALQHRGDVAETADGGLLKKLADQLKDPKLTTAHKIPSARFFSGRDPTVLLSGLESSWPEEFTQDTMEVELNTDLLNSSAKEAATTKDDGEDEDWPVFRSQLTSLPQWVYACVDDIQRSRWRQQQLQWQPANSKQAWFPLFIEWEADYFHIPYHHWALKETPSGTVRYGIRGDVDLTDTATGLVIRPTRRGLSGRSNILPEGSRALTTLVNQVFQRGHPDTIALEEKERDAVCKAVASMTDLLSELEGITDHLLTLVRGTHSTPASVESAAVSRWLGFLFPQLDSDDHAKVLGFLASGVGADVTPYTALLPVQGVGVAQQNAAAGLFRPVTHGQVRFTKFNIIDKFGQVVCAFDPRPGQPLRPLYPSVSEDLACQRNAMLPGRFFANAAEAEPEGRCQFFQLGPRINQDARFNASFVVREETPSVRAWRSLAAWESPIWGWLVCNFQDDSLQVFEGDGTLAGEILVGASPKGRWLHPQLGGSSHDTPSVHNPDLAALMERLAGSNAFLHQVWDMVVEANESIHHAPNALADFLPALIGRPLALVSMGWSLELATAPMRDQTDAGGPTDDLLGYAFELKLGDRRSMHDGLVAYISEDVKLATDGPSFAFDRVYTRYGLDTKPRKGRRAREDSGAQASVSPSSQVVPAEMLSFKPYWVDPTEYGIDQTDKFMAAHARKLQVVAALIDPFQSVHGFSGILPTTTLTVPPAALQDALKQMGTLLRVGPLLIPGDLPAPHATSADSAAAKSAAVLPIDAPAEGSWSWIQPLKLEGSGSRQFSLTPASKSFSVPDGPQTVVEGYLKLDTVDSPGQSGFSVPSSHA